MWAVVPLTAASTLHMLEDSHNKMLLGKQDKKFKNKMNKMRTKERIKISVLEIPFSKKKRNSLFTMLPLFHWKMHY